MRWCGSLNSFCAMALLLSAAVARSASVFAQKRKSTPPVQASAPRGYRDAAFSLKLSVSSNDLVIRYTLDGSEPAPAAKEYTAPLDVTNTMLLRAAAFQGNDRVSSVATFSYIFLDQVLRQPAAPAGLPAGSRAWNGMPSGYQMDPRVVEDPVYRDRMRDALKSLPAVSVVCRREDMFGPSGLYLNTMQRGDEWEKPCSVEMILPDGSTAFQIDCGIRIQGNVNRIPNRSPKHAFRLLFREQYGAAKLHYQMFPDSDVKKFDTLVLRADYNNSWIHWDAQARPRAQRTRDAWMKDSHRAMGWAAGHNRYVHLFLNGLYWGVYDFAERPDADFAAAYLGGRKEDYDVINEFQAKDGTIDAFNVLNSIHGLARNEQYEKLQRFLNVTQYIDYLLLNYYAGNQDWGENKNWYALRRHSPPGPFEYFVWDGEQVLHDVQDNAVIDAYEVPFRLAEELKRNAEFRLAFADRVQKHFFSGGALTPAACAERWMKRASEVDIAMVAESARWGYYRRNPPFTRDREWVAEQNRLLRSYFPKRTEIVLDQFRAAGLYPKIAAPAITRDGGALTFKSPDGGAIYFTTNGLDPRVPFTGAVESGAMAYSNARTLSASAPVKARVLKDRTWSAMAESPPANN